MIHLREDFSFIGSHGSYRPILILPKTQVFFHLVDIIDRDRSI